MTTNAPPAEIQTKPAKISFSNTNVPPSQFLYLQDGEFLAISTLSNTTGIVVKATYRFLNASGEITEGTKLLPATVAGAIATNVFAIAEGWLLSVTFQLLPPATAGQWCYAQLGIIRGNPATPTSYGAVWENYLYNGISNGWPGIGSKEITDGPGIIRSITGTTPAAGAEISETVPSNRRWTLLSARFSLTTSATVANRTPSLNLDDGVNSFYTWFGTTAIPASAGTQISASSPSQPGNATISSFMLFLPNTISLKSNFRWRTSTPGLQAGDQYSAPQYLVIEWGLWDG